MQRIYIYIELELVIMEKRKGKERNRGKSVAGVGNQQAGFADSAVADGDALNEPRRTHLQIRDLSNQRTMPLRLKLNWRELQSAEKGGNEIEIKLK